MQGLFLEVMGMFGTWCFPGHAYPTGPTWKVTSSSEGEGNKSAVPKMEQNPQRKQGGEQRVKALQSRHPSSYLCRGPLSTEKTGKERRELRRFGLSWFPSTDPIQREPSLRGPPPLEVELGS